MVQPERERGGKRRRGRRARRRRRRRSSYYSSSLELIHFIQRRALCGDRGKGGGGARRCCWDPARRPIGVREGGDEEAWPTSVTMAARMRFILRLLSVCLHRPVPPPACALVRVLGRWLSLSGSFLLASLSPYHSISLSSRTSQRFFLSRLSFPVASSNICLCNS